VDGPAKKTLERFKWSPAESSKEDSREGQVKKSPVEGPAKKTPEGQVKKSSVEGPSKKTPEGQVKKSPVEQWYSTGGMRRHLRGYVKFKISIHILFHE
jgi:hypothetical protein